MAKRWVTVGVRVSEGELASWKRAAAGVTVASWLREMARALAKQAEESAPVRELTYEGEGFDTAANVE